MLGCCGGCGDVFETTAAYAGFCSGGCCRWWRGCSGCWGDEGLHFVGGELVGVQMRVGYEGGGGVGKLSSWH